MLVVQSKGEKREKQLWLWKTTVACSGRENISWNVDFCLFRGFSVLVFQTLERGLVANDGSVVNTKNPSPVHNVACALFRKV